MTNKGLMVSGKFDHPIIGIVVCRTGISMESWTQIVEVPSGTDIDDLAEEEAKQNAESFGYEDCQCYEDDCDACSNNRGSMEDVCGTIYKYWPSKSGGYVNGGDPIDEVVKICRDNGGIYIDDEDREVTFYISVLEKLLYMPLETRDSDLRALISGLPEHTIGYVLTLLP